MDGWLKALVAAACLVVIAGGGYFAWSEYQTQQTIKANNSVQAARAMERLRRDRLNEASCGQMATDALSKVTGEQFRTPERRADLKTCNELGKLGYVEKRDLAEAGIL